MAFDPAGHREKRKAVSIHFRFNALTGTQTLRCDREHTVRYQYVVKMICASCTELEGFCGRLPKRYTVSYTYDTEHIHERRPATLSCGALNTALLGEMWRTRSPSHTHTTWYSPRLDQISYRVAFYEEIWLRAQASCNLSPECLEFPRSRIYFSPDACVLDVQASGQLKGFMSDVLVNLTHQSRFSWFLDCHKYWVDVFIRVPFIHKKTQYKSH